jgi:hypothetical protein
VIPLSKRLTWVTEKTETVCRLLFAFHESFDPVDNSVEAKVMELHLRHQIQKTVSPMRSSIAE